MKKIANRLVTLCFVTAFILNGMSAVAAFASPEGETASIIILPFHTTGPDTTALATDIPELFSTNLAKQGLKIISRSQTMAMLKKQNVTELNVNAARNLAVQARATYALYGSFTNMGNGFSLDTRLVSAAADTSASARPYFASKDSMIELYPAIEELAVTMAGDIINKNSLAGVQIRGLKVLDPDAILMRLSTAKGDAVDPVAINQEMKRLWDTGYFSDISADIESTGEGLMLVFTVAERPRIDLMDVEGSDAIDVEDIMEVMTSKTGSVLSEKLLTQDLQKITDLYRSKGYYLAKVRYRVEERQGTASARLVFTVEEGNKLYIKKIAIKGLTTIDESTLRKELALKERGILSWITKSGVLREDYLERDAAALRAWGLSNGYLNMVSAAPQVTYEEDGIIVTFAVNEGDRYAIGDITFSGDIIDNTERLMEVIKLDDLKEDVTWMSIPVMQNDSKYISDFYSDYGYAYAEVFPRTNIDESTKTINIDYQINKKNKIYIRRLLTEGNTRTRDNVILREMRMGDGEPFEGGKLRRSNERLNKLRYFTAVDTTLVPTDSPEEVDLRVKIAEDQTGAIMGGVGYSTYYQFGVSASISERNLFGRGYSVNLGAFLSGKTNSLDFTFINSRLYDTDFGINNRSYVIDEEWDDFKKKTIGNTIAIFHPIGEYTSVGMGYRLDRYTLTNIPETASRAYKDYEGTNLSSVVSARLSYDSTDSHTRPSRGLMGRIFAEYGGGGIGGNDNFIKVQGELQGFQTLFGNIDHVIHWRGRLGAVWENSSKPIPVFDRFYIGGIDSIRGYDYSDISPRDPEYLDEIGGDRMGYLNFEYIWTIEPELGVAIVPFFDIGFENDSKQTSTFSNFKKSVGLELRWRSPMGDLRFAYGYPLDKSWDGKKLSGRFEFSMGQNF